MNETALLYEYAVVRYVPRIEREEFINVGLLMMCKRRRWLHAAFSLNRERLLAFDSAVDIDSLQRQLAMFETGSTALADLPVEERFRWFSAVKSSVIQTSRPHPGLIPADGEQTDAAALLNGTFERLFRELVI